jgi:hypothetical protein
MSASVDSVLERLADVERRLSEHVAGPVPSGLTEPDPGGEERWEAGQVWAHLAEFPAYWLAEVRQVVEPANAEPVPFGRVKTDPGRIAAIERDRHTDPAALLARVRSSLADVSDTLRSLPDEAWQRRGLHHTRREMPLTEIVERMLVGHLEEHADQLDLLGRDG